MPRGSGSQAETGTAADVADWLGLSARRVTELRAAGVLPGGKGDGYQVKECVRAYCAHMRPAAGRNASGGSGQAGSLDEARIEVLHEQRDKLRLLNGQLRGEMVLAEDMEAVVGAVCDAVRAKVLALPSRAAPLVFGLQDPQAVRAQLEDLCHDACGDLAAVEVASSVKDRARRRAGRSADGDPAASEDGATA